MFNLRTPIVVLLVCLTDAGGSLIAQTITRSDILKNAAVIQAQKEKTDFQQLMKLVEEKKWPMTIKGKNGRIAVLSGTDPMGYPLYVATISTIRSAATIRTNQLWAGGSTGLNLSGSGANLKGRLGIWDGGRIRGTHVELNGRIAQRDNPAATSDHSTHVGGILASTGINPAAKGMAFGIQQVLAYDFNSHLSEMLNESDSLLVSNHSYGALAGWQFNEDQNRWEFWGQANTTEDYKFGYYSNEAQMWDSIAYLAPHYLIVKAAGNNRGETGPDVGEDYWRFNESGQMVSSGQRPAGISSNDSYETLSTYANSKNILTVGAVFPIPSGYSRAEDVQMTSFSSWGPTDDGRIKPDVVTNGVEVLSSVDASDNSYAFQSGTSMASPAAAGSVFLLQEHYSKLHAGAFLRSATLKGIIIHTADESGGAPGPDYQFGWGLINMVKAASVITSNNTDQLIQENVLNNSATYSIPVVASGKGPLVVTICWTDPKGAVETVSILNNPAKKLVHDLDLRVKKGTTTYLPWRLDPAGPANPATKGDNITDNVEKIEVPDAVPGETYTIEVTHKSVLQRGSQAYSLIVSGVGGQAYCASSATSNAGARIDSVSFGSLQKANPAGCTVYTDYKSFTANIETNSTVPLFVKTGSCDATNVTRVVKAFIDFNNDGDFTDAGEKIAPSGLINGNGTFTTNATIPPGLTTGNYAILRIVLQETNDSAIVTPCGTYTRGETQDYRIQVVAPSNDLGVSEVVTPEATNCAYAKQYVSVVIKNFGAAGKVNVPVSATVKSGATTIATLNAVFKDSIRGYEEVLYTFQTPFASLAGTTYNITAQVNLTGDQNTANNQLSADAVIGNAETAPSGLAEICGNSVLLRATATSGDVFLWYDSANAIKPIAAGTSTSTAVIKADKTYYVGKNDLNAKLGPVNKLAFTEGGYNAFAGNYMNFTNTQPLVIETARLYIGNPGKITFIVADIVEVNPDGSFSYIPISSTFINAYATDPTPQPGAQTGNDPADSGAVFLLNLPVPTAGNHAIITICEDGATIFRNNNIAANPYPASIPGVISFTGNSATSATDPNFFQRFYYFFYDVGIRLGKCPSARTTVVATTATAPSITAAGTTLTSSSAAGNQWLLNGIEIAGATGQTHVATQTGTYKTTVTTATGCSLSSNELNITVTAVPNVDPAQIGLKVLPNPSNGKFFMEFNINKKATLTINITNMLGQELHRETYPGFIGKFNKQIELDGRLAPGIYLLKVNHNNINYTKKLVVR
ncbi:MAG: S8 family serine peptidase [Chitinophagaceae bacterium]|nr:S8 family serine peptidase [Chitinophagaceae bacterium]